MTEIRELRRQPEASLAASLEDFESEFRYPLGEGRWFRISHGEDYTRFFRAMGDARCFVAEHAGQVKGVLSGAICQLHHPDGEFRNVAYLSDLKLTASADRRCLLRLLQAMLAWVHHDAKLPGFCVVMDGTARNPTSYTGRLGIPPFCELAKLVILRVPCTQSELVNRSLQTSVAEARACFREIQRERFATGGGEPGIRSVMPPTGLIAGQGSACGVLEDTRRCKLLYRDDGQEMVSGHLSSFGYRCPDDAAGLITAASAWCRQSGLPALFVALPLQESDAVLKLLPQDGIVKAPATLYGFGLPTESLWSVNTSEI